MSLLEPEKCVDSDVAVIVHSHASDTDLRSSQREAMKLQETLKPIFVVFHSTYVHIDELKEESAVYNDLLFGDMEESYHNLIYKHVMALRWVKDNCADNIVRNLSSIYNEVGAIYIVIVKREGGNNTPTILGLLSCSRGPVASGMEKLLSYLDRNMWGFSVTIMP